MATSPNPDRRFGFELLLATVLVIGCVATLTFLRTDRGLQLFADGSSAQRLVPGSSVESADGVVFEASHPRTSGRVLGTVELDSRSRYVLVSELGAGDPLVLVLENRELGARLRFRCVERVAPTTCQRLLDARGLPARVELRAWYRGVVPRELRGLSVARLSPVHAWLCLLLQAGMWVVPIGFVLRHRGRLLREPPKLGALDDLALGLTVFGFCFLVFHGAPVQQVQDSRYLMAVSHSILHAGGVELPADFGPGQRDPRPYQIDRVDGRLLHHYSPVPALLDVPVVAVYEWLGVTPMSPDGGRWDLGIETRIMRFSAALVASMLCVVLYLLARKFLAPLPSLGLTFAFAFGTQIFSTLSRPYWSHTWGALLTALAIYFVVFPSERRTSLSMAFAATCVSWSVFARPQNFWAVLGLVAFLIAGRNWRQLGVFVGVGAGWAVAGALFSMTVYDSPLPGYYLREQVEMGRLGVARLERHRYPRNLLGSLFSPSRGVFVFVPLYAWVLAVIGLSWKRLASRTVAIVALLVIGFHLWLLVHTGTWPGAKSFGPRQLSDVLVWFFLLAVLAVQATQSGWRQMSRSARVLRVATLGLCLAFSVFVNTRGAFSRATWNWEVKWVVAAETEDGEPIRRPNWWNWRRPQFMAGLSLPGMAAPDSGEAEQRSPEE